MHQDFLCGCSEDRYKTGQGGGSENKETPGIVGVGLPRNCPFCTDFVAKSPFGLVIKIYFGCTRDFRVKMWGTSSPDDKRTDDLGNAVEGTRFLTAEKLAPGDL